MEKDGREETDARRTRDMAVTTFFPELSRMLDRITPSEECSLVAQRGE